MTIDHISEQDVGKTLRAAGWVENIRDHGGVSFIDLRDMYGVLQVVLRDTSLLKGINKEDCISVEGVMELGMRRRTIPRSRPARSSWRRIRWISSERCTSRFRLRS